jgi:FHS family L-fucose permease-like MFS transporter
MLSQVQSQLVAWAFYVAYFVGSIIFFLVSLKVDAEIWIQKTLSAGLLLSAFGSFMFVPAATMESFPFLLTALFTVGLGFQFSKLLLIH